MYIIIVVINFGFTATHWIQITVLRIYYLRYVCIAMVQNLILLHFQTTGSNKHVKMHSWSSQDSERNQ